MTTTELPALMRDLLRPDTNHGGRAGVMVVNGSLASRNIEARILSFISIQKMTLRGLVVKPVLFRKINQNLTLATHWSSELVLAV